MEERGVARVRVDAVAKEAGLSAGALYRHFSGREDLILAVLMDSVPTVAAVADAPIPEESGTNEALLELVRAIYEHEQRMASIAMTVLADESLHQRFQQAVNSAPGGPQDFSRLIQQTLERYQSAERIRVGLDTAAAAATIQARCFHHAVLERLHPTSVQQSSTDLVQAVVHDLL